MQVKPLVKNQAGFTIIELVVVILLLGILAATALPRFIDVTTEAHDAAFEATGAGLNTGVALYRAEFTARGQPAANSPLQSYGGLRGAPGYSAGTYEEEDGTDPTSFTTPANYTGRSTGYPLSTTSNINKTTAGGFTAMSSLHCVEVFENVLQAGAPSIVRAVDTNGAVITTAEALTGIDPTDEAAVATEAGTLETVIETSAGESAADFTAVLVTIEIDTGFENNLANGNAANGSGLPRNYADNVPACVYAYTGEAESFDRAVMYVPWLGRVESFTSLDDLVVAAQYSGPRVQ